MTANSGAASLGLHVVVPTAGNEIDRLYAADTWRAGELGVPAARGRETVSFVGIDQAWLRQAAKRWAQQRLATGFAFNTVQAAALAFKRFSGFLASCSPPVAHPHEIDRTLIERYWPGSPSSRSPSPPRGCRVCSCAPSWKRTGKPIFSACWTTRSRTFAIPSGRS